MPEGVSDEQTTDVSDRAVDWIEIAWTAIVLGTPLSACIVGMLLHFGITHLGPLDVLVVPRAIAYAIFIFVNTPVIPLMISIEAVSLALSILETQAKRRHVNPKYVTIVRWLSIIGMAVAIVLPVAITTTTMITNQIVFDISLGAAAILGLKLISIAIGKIWAGALPGLGGAIATDIYHRITRSRQQRPVVTTPAQPHDDHDSSNDPN